MTQPLFEPRTVLEHKLHGSLWSFFSSYWSGYVDFREPGHYWTHWGFGTWGSIDERRIRMQNSYDPFSFVLEFDDELAAFRTVESNHHSRPSGHALYFYGTASRPMPPVRVDESARGARTIRVDVEEPRAEHDVLDERGVPRLPPKK